MKTIAICSFPQECGDSLLDFISLESGQIVKTISMEGFDAQDAIETVTHYEPDSEVVTFYDQCTEQRYRIHCNDRTMDLLSSVSTYKNKECTDRFPLESDLYPQTLTILDCQKVEEVEVSHLSLPNKPFITGVWEYKAAHCKVTYEQICHPEQDTFRWKLKASTGIDWPLEERKNLSHKEAVSFIAKKLGYEVLNILFY